MWSGDEQQSENGIFFAPPGSTAAKASSSLAEVHPSSALLQIPGLKKAFGTDIIPSLQKPAFCVFRTKIKTGATSLWGLPPSLFSPYGAAPSRILAHPSQLILFFGFPQALRELFLLPLKSGERLSEAAGLGSQHKGCSPLWLHAHSNQLLVPSALNLSATGFLQ